MLALPVGAELWIPPNTSRFLGYNRKVDVQPGHSLFDLARANSLAIEHLAEANGLPISLAPVDRDQIFIPGLRILPSDPPSNGLVINVPERGFYLFGDFDSSEFFPIAVGKPGEFQTPSGRYEIIEKVVDPEWIAPEWSGLGDDNIVPPGPDNPLGDRWIGLTWSGLGLHSTNDPTSIGSATSHGCMRMYPEIAHTVFDLVSVGWPVTIEYKTSRVSLEKDGIYAVCFPDIYAQVDRAEQLRDEFSDQDLLGFYHLLDPRPLLRNPNGVVTKVVDLEPKMRLKDGSVFSVARIGEKSYVEGAALAALGIEQDIRLIDQVATLKIGRRQAVFPIRSNHYGADEDWNKRVFLSQGVAWFPVREALQGFGFDYRWDGKTKTIEVGSIVSEEN